MTAIDRTLFATLALCAATASTTAIAAPANAASGSDLSAIQSLYDRRDWLGALAAIERAAARDPGDDHLYALRVRTLAQIGARERAWELYRARPDLFDAGEAQRFELDRLARLTTSSRFPAADEAHRLDEAHATDRATSDYLARAGLDTARMPLRLRFDRLALLNQLGRHREVVADYGALRREGHDVPAYAMAQVGDSLMALKRPREAAVALQAAIDGDPGNMDLRIQHGYALLESERFDLALPEFKALVDANAPWPTTPGSGHAHENWNRYDAETNYAMARSYGDDLIGAQRILEPLAAKGPVNSGLQSSLADVYERRGWPTRALQRNRMAYTLDAKNVQSRIGQVEALLDLQRNDDARPLYGDLLRTHADALGVQTLQRRWDIDLGWQGRVYAGSGRSHGGNGQSATPLGQRDGEYGVEVASPLFDDRWRLVASSDRQYADFDGARVRDQRTAAGIAYAHDRLDWRLQANRAFDDVGGTGIDLSAGWRFSDVLYGGMAVHRRDPEASLQARASGITADSAEAFLDYHPSELTSLVGRAKHYRYSDGNRRDEFGADLEQRLLTRPHLFLTGLASAYTGRGSRDDAPYYNPSRNHSLDVGLRIDHLAWRHYQQHFRQRFTATVGNWWQDGYGSAWVPQLRYEHEWQFGYGRVLTYGVSWSRPVYDGARERHLGFDAEFHWGTPR